MAFFKRKNEPALPSGDNSEQIIASVIGALSALVGGTYKDDENGLASVANSKGNTLWDVAVGIRSGVSALAENVQKINEVISQSNVASNVGSINDALKEIRVTLGDLKKNSDDFIKEEKDNAQKREDVLNVVFSGDGDLTKFFKNLKGYELSKKTEESLNRLAEITAKDGSLGIISANLHKLSLDNKELEDLTKSMDALKNIVSTLDETAKRSEKIGTFDNLSRSAQSLNTAVSKIDTNEIKESEKKVVKLRGLGTSIIALSMSLIVVGLIGKSLDYASIAKFAVTLSVFILAITGVYILASNFVEGSGWKGLIAASLMVMGATNILIIGSLAIRFINIANLIKFTAVLGGFLLGIGLVFYLTAKAYEGVEKGVIYAMLMVSGAAFIMVMGAIAMHFINIKDLLLFCGTLLGFLLGVGFAFLVTLVGSGSFAAGAGVAIGMIVTASLVMILGGLAMKVIDVGDLLTFTVTLTAFLFGIGAAFKFTAAGMVNAAAGMSAATSMVAVAAGILIIGSWAMKKIGVGNLWLFILTFDTFLSSLTAIFWAVGKWVNLSLKWAADAAMLVSVAAGVMLIGSLTMEKIKWENLALFIFSFDVFLTSIIVILAKFGPQQRIYMNWASRLAILVGITAGVMIIGANFARDPMNILYASLFTLMVYGFTTGLLAVLTWLNPQITMGLETAKGLAILVGVTAGVMLIGGGVLKAFPDLILYNALFTVELAGFVWAIIGILNSALPAEPLALTSAIALSVIVAVSAGVMLAGGYVIMKNPWLLASVLGFTTLLGLYILAMGAVMTAAASMLPSFAAAIPSIGLLAIISVLGGGIFFGISKLAPQFDYAAITAFGVALSAYIIAMAGVSALAVSIAPMFSVAVPILGMIGGLALMMSGAFLMISVSMEKLSKIEDFNADRIINSIKSFVSVAKALTEIAPYADDVAEAAVAFSSIAGMVEKLAVAVKNYAALRIPVFEGLKMTGFRTLERDDFKEAARNVKTIITVLGSAVLEAARSNPEILETSMWTGRSAFAEVINSYTKLSKLISSIARSVKDYAALRIATAWDENGNAKQYRHLTDEDFNAAARNVKTIITVLGGAVIAAYDENPKMYKDGWFSDSPFVQCVESNMKLGNMISKIAKSVKEYADFKIATRWDENGNAIEFRHLDENDFTNASENVKTVLTLLGGTVIDTYTENEEMFKDSWTSDSPFAITVDSTMKLGKMISDIAGAVKEYANMTIPIWGRNSDRPEGYRSMSASDFTNASSNINVILTTLGKAIIDTYTKNPELYEKGMFDDDSQFGLVVNANTKLSKLISSTAKAVEKYASLRFVSKWDSSGNPVEWSQLGENEFKAAGENIKTILSTLAESVLALAKEDMWKGEFDEDSQFMKCVVANEKLGNIISGTAKGLQSYAKLLIPNKWDTNGNPIGYTEMTEDFFTNAAKNIGKVIGLVGNVLVKFYEGGTVDGIDVNFSSHKDWFEGGDDSIFSKVVAGCSTMGAMMSNIANGIKLYAEGIIPSKLDNMGKVVESVEMTEKVYRQAAERIGLTIGLLGDTLCKFYSGGDVKIGDETVHFDPHESWFTSDNGRDPAFTAVVDGTRDLGGLIGDIAKGVAEYASSVFTDKNGNKITLDNTTFKTAIENISTVVSTLGLALINAYKGNTEMFEHGVKTVRRNAGGLWGLLGGQVDYTEVDTSSTPFEKIVATNAQLGLIVSNIAQGINTFAQNLFLNKDGSLNVRMTEQVYTNAGENIARVVLMLGFSLMELYKRNEDFFAGNGVSQVQSLTTAISGVTKFLSSIAYQIVDYAQGRFPQITLDNKGNLKTIKYVTMNEGMFTAAKTNIKNTMSTIVDAVTETWESVKDRIDLSSGDKSPFTLLTGAVHDASQAVYQALIITGNLYLETAKELCTPENLKEVQSRLGGIIGGLANLYMMMGASMRGNRPIDRNSYKSLFSADHPWIWTNATFADLVEDSRNVAISNTANAITSVVTIIEQVGDGIKRINEAFEKFLGNSDPLDVIKAKISETATSIMGIYDSIVEMNKHISNDMEGIASTATGAYAVNTYIPNFNSSDPVGTLISKLTTISEAVELMGKINTNASKFDRRGITNFSGQTAQVDKFVKVVNSVKLANLQNLNTFVKSLNELARRMGNLDKLTDAISNRLSVVLKELVNRLIESKKTIELSNVMHEERKKFINNSVQTIREIMNKPMVVEIVQPETPYTASEGEQQQQVGGGNGNLRSGTQSSVDSGRTQATRSNTDKVNRDQSGRKGGVR